MSKVSVMKNILAKLPVFIYLKIIFVLILIISNIYILNNVSPIEWWSKILFSSLFGVTVLYGTSLIQTLFLLAEDERYNLKTEYKKNFSNNIPTGVFISLLILAKTFGALHLSTATGLFLIYLGYRFWYFKIRKQRRKLGSRI